VDKPRQNLVSGDVVADIDVALDDLAVESEREIVLHLRRDGAGQGCARREVDHLRGDDIDAGQGSLHLRCVLVASDEQRKRKHSGACSHQSQTYRLVMAGLVPAISFREARPCVAYRDRRDKPGDDDGESLTDDPSPPKPADSPWRIVRRFYLRASLGKIMLATPIALCPGNRMKLFVVLAGLAVGACALQARSSSERLTDLVGKPVAAAISEFQAPESVTRINAGQKSYTFLWRRLNSTGGSMREHLNPVECRFVLIVDAPRDNMPDDQMKIVSFERPSERCEY
jgi:hypothetical protein